VGFTGFSPALIEIAIRELEVIFGRPGPHEIYERLKRYQCVIEEGRLD
jgi:hypothetical protein